MIVLSPLAAAVGGMVAPALLPIVPFMPHGPADLGLFDPREPHRPDTLNRFEHWWAMPVQFVLLLFGFANAGVPFERIGPGTSYVSPASPRKADWDPAFFDRGTCRRGPPSAGPRRRRPAGGRRRRFDRVHGVVVLRDRGLPSWQLAETKMGALLSFAAAPLAVAAARLVGVSRR